MTDQIDALKALQMALARLGYYTGAIDGLFGPRTDAALKAVSAEGGAIRNLKPAVPVPAGPMIFQGSARYPVDEIVEALYRRTAGSRAIRGGDRPRT